MSVISCCLLQLLLLGCCVGLDLWCGGGGDPALLVSDGGGGGKDWPPPGPMPLPTPTRSRSGVLSVGSSLTMLSSSDDDSRNKEGFVEIIVIFTAFGSCKQMMLLYMLPLNPIAGQTGSS